MTTCFDIHINTFKGIGTVESILFPTNIRNGHVATTIAKITARNLAYPTNVNGLILALHFTQYRNNRNILKACLDGRKLIKKALSFTVSGLILRAVSIIVRE